MVATLEENIAVYDESVEEFESKHLGKYVVFYDLELIGIYENSHEACMDATIRFGRGPYLIRLVGRSTGNYPRPFPRLGNRVKR